MKPPQRSWPSPLLRSDPGFTLVELVVGTAISALLIIITTGVLSPQLRMNRLLGGQMRLQERWSRVESLLNTEIAEAHRVEPIYIETELKELKFNGLELITCEPLDSGSSNRCSDGDPASSATGSPGYDVAICYELVPEPASGTSSLQRRGPMIEVDGSLSSQLAIKSCADFTAEVVTTGVTAFSAQEVTPLKVTYAISLRDPFDPNGSSYTKESTASPRPSKY
jgi:prepilin-type N-terminal cleavage/methylation domain-containing protein